MSNSLVPNNDASVSFPVPDGAVGDFFPLKTPPARDDTFEIGLVLGGTVSAAAYTAGAVDYLIEALDSWTVAKTRGDPDAPRHKVLIKILAGTSGGAITSVLLAKVLASAFPHVVESSSTTEKALNPFHRCWVSDIGIRDLLELPDTKDASEIYSLLCASKIDEVGANIAQYKGSPLGTNGTPPVRDYFEQLLPLVVTLTNLRGIPYSSDFRGTSQRNEYYTDFADHMRFRVDITGNSPPHPAQLKPYETGISAIATAPVQSWDYLIHAARGSSAFPVGLPAQTISRDLQHYRYRYATIDGDAGPQAIWLKPAWPYMTAIGGRATDPYEFLSVDGGCFNNEPTEFVRQWLAGVLEHNARDGLTAHRAVLLVDPFAETPDYGLVNNPGVLGTGGATLSAWKNGARYDTADLDLFTAENVYSRFLINPVRTTSAGDTKTGGDAIATDNLAAFGGFLCEAFRSHDYFLGRRNCQQFLRKSFVLDKDNSLFNGWTPPQRNRYGVDVPGFLPIIPLMNAQRTEIPQPLWPKGSFRPESIRSVLDQRLGKLVDIQTAPLMKSQFFLVRWLLDQVISKARGAATDYVISTIAKGLQDADLL